MSQPELFSLLEDKKFSLNDFQKSLIYDFYDNVLLLKQFLEFDWSSINSKQEFEERFFTVSTNFDSTKKLFKKLKKEIII